MNHGLPAFCAASEIEKYNGYHRLQNGQLLRLRVILLPARALDPWRWPKGSQLWGRECKFDALLNFGLYSLFLINSLTVVIDFEFQ